MVPTFPLFVPGDRPDRFAKAAASGADAVIIDLEDAVAPQNKAAARANLGKHGLAPENVIVRVNGDATPFWDEDLAAVAATGIRTILIPKAEREETLAAVRAALGDEAVLLPMIESVRGLSNLQHLLLAPGVAAIAFGHLDFAVDLRCEPDWDVLASVRSTLVVQSRLAGRAAPIDGITADFTSSATAQDAERARRFGFGGKLMIHPAQIAAARSVFIPSEAERAWARAVVDATANGETGVITVDGKMVDRPIIERAHHILALCVKFEIRGAPTIRSS